MKNVKSATWQKLQVLFLALACVFLLLSISVKKNGDQTYHTYLIIGLFCSILGNLFNVVKTLAEKREKNPK